MERRTLLTDWPEARDWPEAIQDMALRWKSSVVGRTSLREFSGNTLNPRSVANLDSLKLGPPRIIIQNRVAYPLRGLCGWLAARTREVS